MHGKGIDFKNESVYKSKFLVQMFNNDVMTM